MDEFTYYEILGNSDQTEGKGPMRVKQMFSTEEGAVDWASSSEGQRACGVMGHGAGEVVRVSLTRNPDGRITVQRDGVWGYRRNWVDQWDYGYLDLRDKPDQDPEWGEYMRLKSKFEGR